VLRLLGPVQWEVAGEPVDLGPVKQRTVLAALAVDAGRLVTWSALIDRVWDEAPVTDARRVLYTYANRIRRMLEAVNATAAGPPIELARRSGGYLLDADPDRVDLHRFRRLVAAAGESRHADPERVGLLGDALRLWRGAPLADLAGGWAERMRESWVQQRLNAAVAWGAAALRIGRHDEVIGTVGDLAAEYPLAEPLTGLLMLALVAAGREAEALGCYAASRARLVEELGTEPGPELRALHETVLRGTVVQRRAAAPRSAYRLGLPVPAQLPADLPGFTGRRAELAALDDLLAAAGADGQDRFSATERTSTAVITAVSGTAGVGKTALAVHWAHRVRDRFPDGQLYVNLNGCAPTPPTRPVEALAHALHALGVPAERAPAEAEEAAALYRSLLADRRVLVLLDNASSPEQVRPLLPGSAGCLVLVTSRNRLSGLTAREGARRLTLDVLSPDEAGTLIARVVGLDRVAAEPAAAAELARACGHLPLALCIAAAHLVDHPERSIAEQVVELRRDRLSALQLDDDPHTAVRAAFDLSYQTLGAGARHLFRLLGLMPGPTVGCDAAAALAGCTPRQAGQMLDRLAAAHLVSQPMRGRYGLHDLLRRYAADRAQLEDGRSERAAAVARLLNWYLRGADAAARLLYPHMLRLDIGLVGDEFVPADIHDDTAALAWLTSERAGLLAAIRHAAHHGPSPVAWLLADALRGYFWRSRTTVDWLEATRAGMTAAVAESNLRAQAALHLSLAMAHQCLGRHDAVIEHYTLAADLARQAGWADGHAASVGNLGIVHAETGRLREAVECQRQALRLYRRSGRRTGQANALANLGWVYRGLGQLRRSADHQIEALVLFQETGSRDAEATALESLGAVEHELGRLGEAHAHCTRALALHRQTGNRYGEVETLRTLAVVHRDAGRHAEALDTAQAALILAREIDEQRAEADAHNVLGTVQASLGYPAQSGDHHCTALRLAAEINAQHPETEALLGLAAAGRDRHRHDEAADRARQALAVARRAGYRVLEGQALTTLATIDLASGRHDAAAGHARQALSIHRRTGYRLGEARTLVVLGHTCGDRTHTTSLWARALEIFAACGATADAAEMHALLPASS
jgi:DNA-binding SARP family transcriptional activator/tetratricopeptide (TPR) repeat protein